MSDQGVGFGAQSGASSGVPGSRQIITASVAAPAAPPLAPAPAAGRSVAARPHVARHRRKSRVVLWTVLAVLVIGVGAYAAVTLKQQRDASAADRELAAYEQAKVDVQPIVADYALPSSVAPWTDCGFEFRCGETSLEPLAAVNAVVDSLLPLGLERGVAECEPGRPPSNARCTATATFRGQPLVTVRASRTDVPFRNFGAPASLSMSVDGWFVAGSPVTRNKPVALTGPDFAAVTLGTRHRAALRCEEPAAYGCMSYLGRIELDAAADRNTLWKATGTALVGAGWRDVDGRCETGEPTATCTVTARWAVADDRTVRVSYSVGPTDGGVTVAMIGLRATERVPA